MTWITRASLGHTLKKVALKAAFFFGRDVAVARDLVQSADVFALPFVATLPPRGATNYIGSIHG